MLLLQPDIKRILTKNNLMHGLTMRGNIFTLTNYDKKPAISFQSVNRWRNGVPRHRKRRRKAGHSSGKKLYLYLKGFLFFFI